MNIEKEKKNIDAVFVFLVFFSIIVVVTSINSSSLWWDEASTWYFASQNSISEIFHKLINSTGSEKQMPLYIILEHFWIAIFGESESAMRCLNIPFAVLYLIFAYKITHNINKRIIAYLVFLLNPCFVYYMNETRPYLILLSLATVIFYYSFYSEKLEDKEFRIINICLVTGFYTHMLFVITIIIPLLGFFYRDHGNFSKLLKLVKRNWFFIPLYFLGFLYFAYTYFYGKNKTIGNAYTPVLINLATIMFYLLGFGGLFLSRLDLKALNFSAITASMVIFTGLLAVVLAAVFITFLKNRKLVNKKVYYLLAIIVLILCMFTIFSIIMNFAFWERHVIMILPVICALLCECLSLEGKRETSLFVLLVILFGISSFRETQLNYYQHENYKLAFEENDSIFLVQSDNSLLDYYGFTTVSLQEFSGQPKSVINISNWKKDRYLSSLDVVGEVMKGNFSVLLTERPQLDSNNLHKLSISDYSENVSINDKYNGLWLITIRYPSDADSLDLP